MVARQRTVRRPERRSKRRVRRGIGGLALALLAWLVYWLGLAPGPGLGSTDTTEPASAAAADPPKTLPPARDRSVSPPPPDVVVAAGPGAPGEAVVEPPVEPSSAAVEDHLWGCLRGMASDDPDRAYDSAATAAGLDLDVGQRARLGEAVTALAQRTAARCEGAVRRAADGRVLEARDQVAPLFDARREEPRAALVAALAAVGVALPAPGGPVEVAAPAPLPRGVGVRVRRGGAIVDGAVNLARGDEVTVELASPRTFPTLSRTEVEPIGADAGRALDQAAAALRGGDRALAVLWLVRARALGGDAARIGELAAAMGR